MNSKGAVLMEYVVLTCFVSLVVLEFLHTQFFNVTEGYVGLGHEWAESVRRFHRALAMPVP